MPFEFNQLFRISQTKMVKLQPLCVEHRLEGKMTSKYSTKAWKGNKTIFCSLSLLVSRPPQPMALPPNSWCGIPLVSRAEAVVGMEGSDLPLRIYPWGAPSCLFVWYRGPILVFCGIKSILSMPFSDCWHISTRFLSQSRLCWAPWVQRGARTVSVHLDL